MSTLFDTPEAPTASTAAGREAPHHNNLTCYTDYRCRQPACVDRYNAHNRERIRAHKTGTWDGLIDATPTRQHIRRLQQADMTPEAIARTAGVSEHTVLDILRPHPSKRRGRRRRIRPDVAAKLLAVRPDNRTSGRVDATGTIRRVQALTALGWPANHIARHAGLSDENSADILKRPRVYLTTAKAIADVYDLLRRKRPERNGVGKRQITIAKNRAARLCWAPPAYWDGHPGAIDDPDFEPLYGKTRLEIIAEDTHWLTAAGLDRGAVAERLGVDRSYVDKALTAYEQAEREAVQPR